LRSPHEHLPLIPNSTREPLHFFSTPTKHNTPSPFQPVKNKGGRGYELLCVRFVLQRWGHFGCNKPSTTLIEKRYVSSPPTTFERPFTVGSKGEWKQDQCDITNEGGKLTSGPPSAVPFRLVAGILRKIRRKKKHVLSLTGLSRVCWSEASAFVI
jgi:hypothetical protein